VWSVDGKFERHVATPAKPYDALLVHATGAASGGSSGSGKLCAVVVGLDHRVHVIDSVSGQVMRSFGAPGSGVGQFYYPCSLALWNGELWISDQYNDRLVVMK